MWNTKSNYRSLMKPFVFLILLLVELAASSPTKPNNVLVFLGDSNTQYGSYPSLIRKQLYKQNHNTKVINFGKSGSTAYDTLKLVPEVLAFNPTIICLMFGVNDIGWGGFTTDEAKTLHLQSMMTLVQIFRAQNIKVYVLSYPMTDFPRDGKTPSLVGELTQDEDSFLQLLGNDVMTVTERLGAHTIDLQSQMRELAKTSTKTYTRDDGVHLNKIGNIWIAQILIKTLEVP